MILADMAGLDQKTFNLAAGQGLDRPSLSLSPDASVLVTLATEPTPS